MVRGGDQERLVHAGVVQVVGHGRDQRRHDFERGQVLADLLLLEEAVHGLRHVRGVYRVVVRVVAVVSVLHEAEELPHAHDVQLKVVHEAVPVEEVDAEHGERAASCDGVQGEGVEGPQRHAVQHALHEAVVDVVQPSK